MVRGQKPLGEADIIIYAGSSVNPALLDLVQGCVVYNSATMTLEQVIDVMKEAGKAKRQTVARLTREIQPVWGAIREQIDALDALDRSHDDCPGVSSFHAERLPLEWNIRYGYLPECWLIPEWLEELPIPERESIASFAAHQATMVVFLHGL